MSNLYSDFPDTKGRPINAISAGPSSEEPGEWFDSGFPEDADDEPIPPTLPSSKVPVVEGRKDDEEKDRWELLPTDALRQIVKVLTFGARKYQDRNWERGIAYSRVYAALLRHTTAWWEGEDLDPETGLPHLAHLGCCAVFLLSYTGRGLRGFDDRPRR